MYKVPFKTSVDFWVEALESKEENIDRFFEIQKEKPEWTQYDRDLHVYPYVHAVPSMLSMGCPNQCKFCPTSEAHHGIVKYGNPEIVIPKYAGMNVHFSDENFFTNPRIKEVLWLLHKHNIKWSAMSDYKSVVKTIDKFGLDYLSMCGCKCLELGLENVVHMKKVKEYIPESDVEIYYLNMTLFPGETKESIRENAEWMKGHDLRNPIHYNNGTWYAPGQYYFPYDEEGLDGIMLESELARTRPTFAPRSLLEQTVRVVDMSMANYYSQLVSDLKIYPRKEEFLVSEFLKEDGSNRMAWLCTGIRAGAIV